MKEYFPYICSGDFCSLFHSNSLISCSYAVLNTNLSCDSCYTARDLTFKSYEKCVNIFNRTRKTLSLYVYITSVSLSVD